MIFFWSQVEIVANLKYSSDYQESPHICNSSTYDLLSCFSLPSPSPFIDATNNQVVRF
jgi:hypothetical protein